MLNASRALALSAAAGEASHDSSSSTADFFCSAETDKSHTIPLNPACTATPRASPALRPIAPIAPIAPVATHTAAPSEELRSEEPRSEEPRSEETRSPTDNDKEATAVVQPIDPSHIEQPPPRVPTSVSLYVDEVISRDRSFRTLITRLEDIAGLSPSERTVSQRRLVINHHHPSYVVWQSLRVALGKNNTYRMRDFLLGTRHFFAEDDETADVIADSSPVSCPGVSMHSARRHRSEPREVQEETLLKTTLDEFFGWLMAPFATRLNSSQVLDFIPMYFLTEPQIREVLGDDEAARYIRNVPVTIHRHGKTGEPLEVELWLTPCCRLTAFKQDIMLFHSRKEPASLRTIPFFSKLRAEENSMWDRFVTINQPHRTVPHWTRDDIDRLTLDDMEDVAAFNPIVYGIGYTAEQRQENFDDLLLGVVLALQTRYRLSENIVWEAVRKEAIKFSSQCYLMTRLCLSREINQLPRLQVRVLDW